MWRNIFILPSCWEYATGNALAINIMDWLGKFREKLFEESNGKVVGDRCCLLCFSQSLVDLVLIRETGTSETNGTLGEGMKEISSPFIGMELELMSAK